MNSNMKYNMKYSNKFLTPTRSQQIEHDLWQCVQWMSREPIGELRENCLTYAASAGPLLAWLENSRFGNKPLAAQYKAQLISVLTARLNKSLTQ